MEGKKELHHVPQLHNPGQSLSPSEHLSCSPSLNPLGWFSLFRTLVPWSTPSDLVLPETVTWILFLLTHTFLDGRFCFCFRARVIPDLAFPITSVYNAGARTQFRTCWVFEPELRFALSFLTEAPSLLWRSRHPGLGLLCRLSPVPSTLPQVLFSGCVARGLCNCMCTDWLWIAPHEQK